MNKLFSIFILALLVVSPMVIATTPIIPLVVTQQLAIRHADLERTHYRLSLLAEGFTNYIQEIGGDTSELNDLRNQFDDMKDDLLSGSTHTELNQDILKAKGIIDAFVAEYNAQLSAHNGTPSAGTSKALANLVAHKSEAQALDAKFWEVNQENSLEIFDHNMEQAENFIDWMDSHGYDASSLTSILDKIKAKRVPLEQALQQKNPFKVQGTLYEIGVLAQQFGTEADRIIKGSGKVCAQDVQECPDGSFVGRDPAKNCQFKPCP